MVVTVTAWIRRSGTSKENAGIITKTWKDDLFPTYASYGFVVLKDPSSLAFHTGHSGGFDQLSLPTGSLPDETWVHVAAVYDPTGPLPQKRLYRNGAPSGLPTTPTKAIEYDKAATGALFFGRSPMEVDHFKGFLDDVRIYNRALSDAEIAAIAGGNQGSRHD